jgi:amino acid transporter
MMKETGVEGVVFTRNASGLVRELSWWDVFIISTAAPAGSGILYFSVSTASAYPGGSIGLAFLLGMVMYLPICLVAALLSTAMPRSASLYVSISRFIDPTVAYIAGLLFLVGHSISAGVLGHVIMKIIGGILVSSGIASGNVVLKQIGTSLQTPFWSIAGGILWVFLFWGITLLGARPFKKMMRIVFIIPVIATVIAIFYFLFSTPAGAVGAFNHSWGSEAYEKILAAATANGWVPAKFSWSATFGLLLVVAWAYNGIEMASYAGGEIKTPKKSMVRGFMWGWAAVGLLYIILAAAVFRPFGSFIGAYDFLYNNRPEVLQTIMPAISTSVPFFVLSLLKNSWMGIVIALGMALWFANTILPIFLSNSRLVFALAMDRAVPQRMADVSPRTGAPTWATHLTAIFAVGGVFFSIFNVKVVLGTLMFATLFIFWLYGLSAMLFPYRRPDIYEKCPIKTKIFGIPLVTLAGFVTFVVGWFFLFLSAREITIPVAIVLSLLIFLGMILYIYQYARNRRNGVNISKIYSEIPPE